MIELEQLVVPDAAALRSWLESGPVVGVWLTLAKKGVTDPTSLTYDQAVDEALCFGWIDGQGRSNDQSTYFIRFTPRRSRSIWSRRNVDHVARLVREGRMQPAGLAEVERAKADGRWDAAYAGPASIEMADDLAAALAADAAASAIFDVLTRQNRFTILYRLNEAKKPETRRRRLEQFVTMLAAGETPYPQKKRMPQPGALE